MDSKYLRNLSYRELCNLAEDMGLSVSSKKDELIDCILVCFREYEEYKRNKIDSYERCEQIGNTGKEGVTYLVKTKGGK